MKDTKGKVVEWLVIDKNGIMELNSKGNQKWGMVAEWEIAGEVLVAKRDGETKRLYAMRRGPDILQQGITIKGSYLTKDKMFVRAAE